MESGTTCPRGPCQSQLQLRPRLTPMRIGVSKSVRVWPHPKVVKRVQLRSCSEEGQAHGSCAHSLQASGSEF